MQLSSQLMDRILGVSGETGRNATVLPVGCRRAPERRQVARMAFGQRTQIRRDQGAKAGTWESIMVQDISPKGIGFMCDEPLEPGETFMLKLMDREENTIRIRCTVQRCERGGYGQVAFMLWALFLQVIHQTPLQLNEDDPDGQVPVEAMPSGARSPLVKPAHCGMARVAVNFLKAVDPVRAASRWMSRADDFS
jgi:hypothetical protein